MTRTVTVSPGLMAPADAVYVPAPMRYWPPVTLMGVAPPRPPITNGADSIHALRGMRKRGAKAKLSGVVSTLAVLTLKPVENVPTVRMALLGVLIAFALVIFTV